MRVAALYDVHGNLPALEAVLRDLEPERVDEIVCGGDVTWGPFQRECIALLRDVGARFVRGNCEDDVLHGSGESERWCRARLTDADRAEIATWPLVLELAGGPQGTVLFCHATPGSNRTIVTRSTPEEAVSTAFAGVTADLVVCGHTHVQYERRLPGGGRVVNAGSIGLAYEDELGARWALIGAEIELRHTVYDLDEAAERLAESGFPRVDEVFGAALRGEVTPEAATASFEARRGA